MNEAIQKIMAVHLVCLLLIACGPTVVAALNNPPVEILAPQETIRVMTYNILNGAGIDPVFEKWAADHGYPGNRLSKVLEAIKAADPDILGIQEAHGWDKDYPTTIQQVADELHMSYFIGGNGLNPNYFIAFLTKFKIKKAEDYSENFVNGALRAEVLTPQGRSIQVFVVHFIPPEQQDKDKPDNLKGIPSNELYDRDLSFIIEKMTIYSNNSIILMGDMNKPDILTGDTNKTANELEEAFSKANLSVIADSSILIDSIWVSPTLKSNCRNILIPSKLTKGVSDHLPVLAEIKVGTGHQKVAKANGMISDAQAVDLLIRSLKENDSVVRWNAAEALGKINNTKAVDALLEALQDNESAVRYSAVYALGNISDTRAVNPLILTLKKDNDYEVLKAAAYALGNIGEASINPLIQSLKENDSLVQIYAAMVLIKIGKPAVDPLIHALENDNDNIRRCAAEILGSINNTQAIDPLIQILKDNSSRVRQSAAWALKKIGTPAVDPLIHALKDNNTEIRAGAVQSLGECYDRRATEPLIQALKDNDTLIRGDAAEALGKINDTSAVNPLILAIGDEDSNVRCKVAWALGNIGDVRAKEPLTQALKDQNWYVRQAAAKALENIRIS